MKGRILAFIAALSAGSMIAAPVDVMAANKGKAKQSVKHSGSGAKSHNNNRRPVKQPPRGGYNQNRPGNQGRNPPPRNNHINAGNTVVVNHNVDRNYHGSYNHDYYHGHWDDDDDDFLEFVGKTAAVTAGVGITAAIIGEIVDDEPDNCQESVQYGQTYLYCNGTWYQPAMYGSNMQYVVVEDPR